ncbi:MAG TPA: hypothetical protein VIJ92_11545 [Ginsengibacter sp.]
MKLAITDKVFLLLLSVIILFTAFWIFHTNTVLQNDGLPTNVVRLFDLNNDLLYNIVTIFSIILLLLSNIFYWRTGNGIYFLWSVFYFTAGIISLAILENARFHYTKQNGIWNDKFSSGFIVSVYLILILIAITIINFFIITYLRKKIITKRKKYERLFGRSTANLN